MDRNTACDPARQYVRVVATREGGVDRNQFVGGHGADVRPSPPARVAWIEMTGLLAKALWPTVATREGGVDRNIPGTDTYESAKTSPPARVAWIETSFLLSTLSIVGVATREGGVDRNIRSLLRSAGT